MVPEKTDEILDYFLLLKYFIQTEKPCYSASNNFSFSFIKCDFGWKEKRENMVSNPPGFVCSGLMH